MADRRWQIGDRIREKIEGMMDDRLLRSLGRRTSTAVASEEREENHCSPEADPPTYDLISVADKFSIEKCKLQNEI